MRTSFVRLSDVWGIFGLWRTFLIRASGRDCPCSGVLDGSAGIRILMSLRNLSAAAGDVRLGTTDTAAVPGRVHGPAGRSHDRR